MKKFRIVYIIAILMCGLHACTYLLMPLSENSINQRHITLPLRYNNDKRKKPLFSRGLSVCRHLFNSFSKLKCDEKIIEKRRLFH